MVKARLLCANAAAATKKRTMLALNVSEGETARFMAAGYIIRPMPMLEGKTGLILGVANKRSIAWAIAQALSREGMRLAFTYQGERLKEGVEALTSTLSGSVLLPCDVTSDSEIDNVISRIGGDFGRLDCLVHSVAFAPREDLEN